MGSGISQREARLYGRENCKLNDQVRVIELRVEELESVRTSALDNVERG